MVASRSDTKRRRRDSSPLDTNPKRTKVHAQRKFAQGVGSTSNIQSLTPVKEKPDKSRNCASVGNPPNDLKEDNESVNTPQSDVASTGKRALPARGAKKPSIEDMITFLCYRGTAALPANLAHLNKAPSPEPPSLILQGASENARGKCGDKTSRDSDKGTNKKPLKSSASSAPKAVTAAQALKRKYQEQRIKKTSVSVLNSKVKAVPLLRTTRSSAGVNSNLSPRSNSKKVVAKRSQASPPSKKKDVCRKESSVSKTPSKSPRSKQSTSKTPSGVCSSSGNRGGLRSGRLLSKNVSQSKVKRLNPSVPFKKKKSCPGNLVDISQQSKKLATSLSDFSSEDDQPLVKKHKPLGQVQKLIKKSLASIGRKIKIEPRRSKRGHSSSSLTQNTSLKRTSGGSTQQGSQQNESVKSEKPVAETKVADHKLKSQGKKSVTPSASKEVNGVVRRNVIDSQRKDTGATHKSNSVRIKKGYVMELVLDNSEEGDAPLGPRSRRGSRDLRDASSDGTILSNQLSAESVKISGDETRKKDQEKTREQLRKSSNSFNLSSSKTPYAAKGQVDMTLPAVLKCPPDLRIPPSIKRPLAAVGITNPMAIAAAAAVVCKSVPVKMEEKSDFPQSKDILKVKRSELKGKDLVPAHQKPNANRKSYKDADEVGAGQLKPKHSTDTKPSGVKKELKVEQNTGASLSKKRPEDTSEDDSKPIANTTGKDKKSKVNSEALDTGKTIKQEDLKPRLSRKNSSKQSVDTDECLKDSKARISLLDSFKSSDDEQSKISSRARRSNVRSSKKSQNSDDENSNESVLPHGADKTNTMGSKKVLGAVNESENDSNSKFAKRGTHRSKHQSSNKNSSLKSKKSFVESQISVDDGSSETDIDNHCIDSSLVPPKPSTRSCKSRGVIDAKLRTTRSGQKTAVREDGSTVVKTKQKRKLDDKFSSSDDELDSRELSSPVHTKTRSKRAQSEVDALSDSSDDETDEISPINLNRRSQRSRAAPKRNAKTDERSASGESGPSSSEEIDDDEDFDGSKFSARKSKRKVPAPKKPLKRSLRKSSGGLSSDVPKGTLTSDEDSGGRRKSKDRGKERLNRDKSAESKALKRPQSPRRSSRRSVVSVTQDGTIDSPLSDETSSESSPSQNRRVLRERKGFFSFAEVDPPSDSEEDVIAATKASLEMIQQSSGRFSPSPSVETAESSKMPLDHPSTPPSQDADKEGKIKLLESPKSRSKAESAQSKKSLSKKRVKAPSEVQPNLNEELEKTLLSINLSPQSAKTIDKAPEGQTSQTLDCATPDGLSNITSPESIQSLKQKTSAPLISSQLTSSKYRKPIQKKSIDLPATIVESNTESSTAVPKLAAPGPFSAPQPPKSCSGVLSPPTGTTTNVFKKAVTPLSKVQKMPIVESLVTAPSTLTTGSVTSACTSSALHLLPKKSISSSGVLPIASHSFLSTVTMSSAQASSSMMAAPSSSATGSPSMLTAPLPVPVPTAMASTMPTSISPAIPVSMPTGTVTGPMQASMALPMSAPMPVSMSIPLNTPLSIPIQTSGNVPLSATMSGTMTLPLQVGPLASGTSGGTPFLVPVQSTLTPMLAPGQTLMKKESGNIGGMPNPVGGPSPLMVGMNPLVVNSNRGAFFLPAGSTMTMTSSQQQIVSGPLMPSLLSLRFPDKPAGQQTIVASSPLYVPFPFGNTGIIQTQGQVQPQIQTVAGVSTITAIGSSMQNTVGQNVQNAVASNIQNAVAPNLPSTSSANIQSAIQNPVTSNAPKPPIISMTTPGTSSGHGSSSASSAGTLTLQQGAGGTGMKRQVVLATKNGPVPKLILSVGEDGSHVLAEASPNCVTSSEEHTVMSVMQTNSSVKLSGSSGNYSATQSYQTKSSAPSQPISPMIAPKPINVPSKAGQNLLSYSTANPVVCQPVNTSNQCAKLGTASGTNSVSVNSCIITSSATPVLTTATVGGSFRPNSLAASSSTSVPCSMKNFTSSVLSSAMVSSASSSNFVGKGICSSSNTVVKTDSGPISATSSRSFVASAVASSPMTKSLPLVSSVVTSSPSVTKTNVMSPGGTSATVPASRIIPSRPSMTVSSTLPATASESVKVTVAGSPIKSASKLTEVKLIPLTTVNSVSTPVLTSRIPSAPAALAALKSSSGVPAPARAVAKTGSNRKPYSTAASYASGKTAEVPIGIDMTNASSSSSVSISTESLSPATSPVVSSAVKPADICQSQKVSTASKVIPFPKPTVSLSNLKPIKDAVSSVSRHPDQKQKGCEVELAPTHRTLSMLSTAFQGNIMGKDRKRDTSSRRTGTTLETSRSSEKRSEPSNIEKSGLENLAEVATSLAERSVEVCGDKRTPEHSLWTNPAQILGKETLRVPGLPITANVGSNLPTKNELAKMKSGALLADVVEKRDIPEIEKLSKVKGSQSGSDSEKKSVSGLLTSSKAETPRQKVQKWLDGGSKSDADHKANCGLLSDENRCTCDAIEEDISNLNSLAEVCINMERINSPVKDQKPVKPYSKTSTDKKRKQELVDNVKDKHPGQSSPVKSSLPLNSHQMKVTWQNAFGVKSPSKNAKSGTHPQIKRNFTFDDVKKNLASSDEPSGKSKKVSSDKVDVPAQKCTLWQNSEKGQNRESDSFPVPSVEDLSQERKLAQRRFLLSRAADHAHSKLGSSAFSADNESSVYAFEADTDSTPVNQPFRRRSKTSSRSDEEDSVSGGSSSNPIAVHVSKDPVFVPIQLENDGNITPLSVSTEATCEKKSAKVSPDDDSDVYYIPIGGHEGNNGEGRAVAVRLGKEGPDNRVVMSAKLVKKPATFKHPSDSNEDGLPHKRAKVETATPSLEGQSSSLLDSETEASSSKSRSSSQSKPGSQGFGSGSRKSSEKSQLNQKDPSKPPAADSSSKETPSSPQLPSSSRDFREARNSMSPASRNRSPMSDKASPPAPHNKKKVQGRTIRQPSIDSDSSEKAKSSCRGSKSKSASLCASPSPSLPSTSSSSSGPPRPSQKSNRSYNGPVPGNVSEAPVFHPSEKEFQDPYAYIEKIRPIAEKYGLCRIVAPTSFKPDCNVEDDIRFTADNQYVHKMMDRWGPNAKEMRAIVKYIAQHNIHLKHAPLVGGMEIDLPRLYTTVQNFGGLMEVMDKKRWTKVAETMRIPKSAQDRASKLDEVYCKCLLPYETLKTSERDNLFEMVEVEWEMRKERRDKRLAASATPPGQPAPVSQPQPEEDEDDDDSEDDEEDECIVKGRSMPLTTFYRTARNTTHMWFKGSSPSASEVEHEFWRHVKDRNFHICVNAGSVDCSDPPYGFPIRNSPFAKHPWNLKVFSNGSGSVLRSLGSVIGVTVPTLHFGMVFTTCCWYRDPHGLPWIEYLHTGAKKIWYGIPEHGAEKFREAMQEVAPHYVRKKALWLASDTAMIPPSMLTERKVPLCRTVQEPGQFIVVFPQAHTSSVATGYIVSESVSFAPPSWLRTAISVFEEMKLCNEPPLFSLEKLIFCIAEDPRTSLHVLNTILPCVMDVLEKEITGQQNIRKAGVNSWERIEKSKKKSSGKKSKPQKEAEEVDVLECDVCSANLFLSMVVNMDDDVGFCAHHAFIYLNLEKLKANRCKMLYRFSQNELHEFCQTLLDRIETKSGKKGNTSCSSTSDCGSSASTSTRN